MEDWTTILSISVFAILILAEIVFGTKQQLELYESKDTFVNICLGLFTFISKVASKGLILQLYLVIYQYVPFKLPADSVIFFLIALLINDFMFYWYHRMSHTTWFFWALHVAHHSSGKMNITTALRGNFVNNLFHAIFWIPMLFLGFSPWVILMTDALSYFYQLWLHTRIIPKLGPLEKVLNTPSHHRVHHGSNPQYIDKNYAAIFIFWDRLFGSFEEEDEVVEYGLTKPIETHNPIKVAFGEFAMIFRVTASLGSWSERIKVLFQKPKNWH